MGTGVLIFLAIILPVGVILLWVLLQDAFVRIESGQTGLVITRGKPADHGLMPGTHFALRFARVIEIYPAVEMTYLTAASATDVMARPDDITFMDAPMPVTLGDRASATIQYTVRFKVTSEGLPVIHTRFGAQGFGAAIRDESRRVIIAALAEDSVGVADAFGPAKTALEERIAERLSARITECGFAMAMFNLRDVNLGETGAVVQATLRAGEQLALEQASGPVRTARAQNEAEVAAKVADTLSDPALEYLRLQIMRELIQRWDGKIMALPEGVLPGMGVPAGAAPDVQPPQTSTQ